MGLQAAGNQAFSQANLLDTPNPNDQLGRALTANDFDNDGAADLAIGVPSEDTPNNYGAVNVVNGQVGVGLTPPDVLWHQDVPNVDDLVEPDDQFGLAVAGR